MVSRPDVLKEEIAFHRRRLLVLERLLPLAEEYHADRGLANVVAARNRQRDKRVKDGPAKTKAKCGCPKP